MESVLVFFTYYLGNYKNLTNNDFCYIYARAHARILIRKSKFDLEVKEKWQALLLLR